MSPLRQTEAMLGGLLEAAPDAMVVVDRDGRMALVNAHTEELFGYGRDELLGERVELLVPSEKRDRHSRDRERYQGDPHRRPMGSGLELTGRRKDGSEFPVEISLSPVETEVGPMVVAAVRDITDRALVQRALKAANRELEAFTYSVSHDLRAPIRQIDGFSTLLEEHAAGRLDDQGLHYLRRIREGAAYMGLLVDDLLNLARIGQQDLQPKRVSLETLIAEIVTDLRDEVAGRDIEWSIGSLPEIICDPGLTKIMFTNLLSNAIKYTGPRPRAVVEVGAEVEGGRTTIVVRDNGVGFDMQYADKLFGVFQRLHRTEEFDGQGVGLATVQRIVHKHDGEIRAEARPDEGAAFYVTLPAWRVRMGGL